MNKALIVMDYINEIIHPEGKLAGKGYNNFADKNGTLDNVADAITTARNKNIPVVYVGLGFSKSYVEQPKGSPLFGKADEYKALQLGSWATQFHESIAPHEDDVVFTKHRVSPFYGTSLDMYLRNNDIEEVYLAGVATDLVVQSAARDAHDRDYKVTVLDDCCAAGSDSDHQQAIGNMSKIATIAHYKDVL